MTVTREAHSPNLHVIPTETAFTVCRICMAACGLEVSVQGGKVVKISPDKQNPYSWQDFCAKGRTAHQLVEHPRRLRTPMRRVGDGYVQASWDEAISDIAQRLNQIIAESGPDAVACYWGNPVGFSSANSKFMTGFMDAIGSQSRYFVGSVDQNAMHVVAEAMYGSYLMALVSDIEDCDYFLLVGANPAVSGWNWIENVPGGWRRALDRQRAGATIVVVDPVRTPTAEAANVHVAVRPGQDWAFLLGLVKVILDEGLEHRDDCRDLATGVDDLRRLVAQADLAALAQRCDVPVAQIQTIARDLAKARGAMVITRTGVSLHLTGTIGEWLGQVLNVITGRMDRPGGRRYERGYVDALKLADLMMGPMKHVSRVHGRPMIAGHHALAELPDEITTPGNGQVRALIIDAGNPVVSGPDGARLDAALAQLDLLVAIDLVQRESHRHADWLLPAAHWLERDDLGTLMSGLQDRPFAQFAPQVVAPPEGVREEWQIFTDLCLAMKRPLFGRRGVNAVVKTTRRLSRALRRPGLAFDPMWIDRLLVTVGRRAKWRDIVGNPHGHIYGAREFGNFRSALRTPDGKVHAAPVQFVARATELLAEPAPAAPAEYPYQLANRRHRHSMNSWLNELPGLHPRTRRNDLIVHPKDAAELGIRDGDRVRVFSPVASLEVTAAISEEPRRGVVILDHGWGSRIFDPAGGKEPESYGVNRNSLVDAAELDPLSQTAAQDSSYVGVERIA